MYLCNRQNAYQSNVTVLTDTLCYDLTSFFLITVLFHRPDQKKCDATLQHQSKPTNQEDSPYTSFIHDSLSALSHPLSLCLPQIADYGLTSFSSQVSAQPIVKSLSLFKSVLSPAVISVRIAAAVLHPIHLLLTRPRSSSAQQKPSALLIHFPSVFSILSSHHHKCLDSIRGHLQLPTPF